jgi:hypothetical protein
MSANFNVANDRTRPMEITVKEKGRQSDGPIVLFAGGIKKRKLRLRTLDKDCHSRP